MKTKIAGRTPAWLLLVCVLLQGCETVRMRAPAASEHNVAFLRAAGLAPVSVGNFAIDPKNFGKNGRIDLRGAYLGSPYGGTFGEYLREIIKTEFAAAGLYQANAETVITGVLTEGHLDAGWSTGAGSLKGVFSVTSKGVETYRREIGFVESWESSLAAAVAESTAVSRYEGMFQKMVGELFNDPAFHKALRDRQR